MTEERSAFRGRVQPGVTPFREDRSKGMVVMLPGSRVVSSRYRVRALAGG
ncbi:hypothetical protein GCM10027063_40800 [Promicromonospora xylanilytica]